MSVAVVLETLRTAQMTLPALELTVLLSFLSVCLMFEFMRAGLIVAYIFVFKWGMTFFISLPRGYFSAYLMFGVLVGALSVVAMLPTMRRR